jgi:hypothetical protein
MFSNQEQTKNDEIKTDCNQSVKIKDKEKILKATWYKNIDNYNWNYINLRVNFLRNFAGQGRSEQCVQNV